MVRNVWRVGTMTVAIAGLCMLSACDNENGGDTATTPPTSECSADIDSIQILQPTATDTSLVGEPFTIKWCLPSLISAAQVDFSNNDGRTWRSVVPEAIDWPENTLAFTPETTQAGTECRVRVAEYGNVDATAVISAPFVVLVQ